MSLASLLLGGSRTATSGASTSVQVDNELDALFRSNPTPTTTSHPVDTPTLPLSDASFRKSSHVKGSKRKREDEPTREHKRTSSNVEGSRKPSMRDSKKRLSVTLPDHEEAGTSEDENDARLEDNYLSRDTTTKLGTSPVEEDVSGTESSGENDPPVHETRVGSAGGRKTRSKSHKKAKYIPPDETPAQRDARTIFVGNIPTSVAKTKSLQKQLKRHFLSRVTGSKIESIRFRSVAFASATAALPIEDTKPSSKKDDNLSTKQLRQQERAAQWRESGSNSKTSGKRTRDDDETSEREDSHSVAKKTYLSPAERKRVAFIKGEFHKEVDTLNGYIVFAHNEPQDDQESTASGRTVPLHPFEAARLAVEKCDGSLFLERTIRVDRVGQWRVGVGTDDALGAGGDHGGTLGDPRATLFVGNLDFAAKEEDLRVWFEGVVSQERGPPPLPAAKGVPEGKSNGDEENDGSEKGSAQENGSRWVRSVRIVRDRDTQLGKGFAYVRFLDRECVDEILGLEPSKLKFAKRKLRVQRCKIVPSSSVLATTKRHKATPALSAQAKKSEATANATSFAALPKGDPSLGKKLAGLSKEERKEAKAANVDRMKRRLAKKKLRENVQKAEGGKDRKRERPRLQKKSGGKAKVVNKRRVRSEKSVAKRNAKK